MKNTWKLFAAVAACGALLAACAARKNGAESQEPEQEAPVPTYAQITQEEAKNLMDSRADLVILDVRRPDEFESGHIPGAICIPNETIDETVRQTLKDPKQTILVYCRSGRRSKEAAEKLVNLGYTDVREFGGILTWAYGTTTED